jgi:tetratricopeptide (TPR) repeat protein
MSDINNVNLLYQRKVRGIAPLSRFAVQDDGSVLASAPDEMEVRSFHIVRYDPRGRSQIVETYSVETLRRTEIGSTGQTYIGTTDDDLYLFRDGRKTRFQPDRRASYTDVAFGEAGQRFAAAFCDMLASGHALLLGDSSGRLLWTKDVAFAVARIAVDRGAQHIAVGGEDGEIVVLDAARNVRMRHQVGAPVDALATVGPLRTVFGGGGGVGAVDSEGKLLWFAETVGDPTEVAIDTAGLAVAAIVRLDDHSGRLLLLSADGLPAWDVDYEEARPTGLSLSSNGRFAAVSLRDGTLAVYELQYGERLGAADPQQILNEAHTAQDMGNHVAAVELLRARLAAVPSDARACEALADALVAVRERGLAASEAAEAVGDFREADARLADVAAAWPTDAEVTERRRGLRTRWSAVAMEAGAAAVAAGDGPTAEKQFLEAIEADPLDTTARASLADARHAAAETALARGRAFVDAGRYTDAITALIEAQARGASGPAVTGLLSDARAGEAMALGNKLYQDRQYAAALFQFKKVLRLDPNNAEAMQKINYAQNFLADTQLNDRFTRLE